MTRVFFSSAVLGAVCVGVLGFGGLGCGVIYPEVKTPLKAVPPGRDLDPPPPPNVLYIALESVEIPNRTRDGRSWDKLGTGLPDPFAVVLANGEELFRTPVERDTLKPTWPKAPKTSYELPQNSKLEIQIWDDNAIHKKPICSKELRDLQDYALTGSVDLACQGGTEIHVIIKAAEAKFGLGFGYEFRADGVVISSVMPLSPASRAGLTPGMEVVSVMGKSTSGQTEGAVKSAINANASTGLKLSVKSKSGNKSVELKEGPIYLKGN